MKTSKALRVKYSPVFEEQLKKLREAIREKNSKFHNQLLKAIEREKDNLLIDMHRGILKEFLNRAELITILNEQKYTYFPGCLMQS